MKWFVILACFMIVTPCLLFSQEKGESEPAKAQFRTVSFGKEFDWNGDRKTMTESLNKLGTDGWEVCLCNQRCILLRKSKVPQKWEYKLVKVGRSPLTEWYGYKKEEPKKEEPKKENSPKGEEYTREGDDEYREAFILILERLEAEAWQPCACSPNGVAILFKRHRKDETKKEEPKKENPPK